MQKIIKISGIVVGIILLFCIGKCFYMVACISCTPDPVKTYNYPGTMDQLENNFKMFAEANPDIYYKISRRGVGLTDARDITIKLKINNSDIECHLVIYDFNGSTKLDIDEIFDNTHKKGDNNENDKNVKELLNRFEKYFLLRFQKDQDIQLKTPFFNFF
jgi:hypothetical protein